MPSATDTWIDDNIDRGPPVSRTSLLLLAKALRSDISVIERTVEKQSTLQAVALSDIRPLAEVEQLHILHALKVTGNVLRAARLLGIGQATLYRRIETYRKNGVALPVWLSRRPTP